MEDVPEEVDISTFQWLFSPEVMCLILQSVFQVLRSILLCALDNMRKVLHNNFQFGMLVREQDTNVAVRASDIDQLDRVLGVEWILEENMFSRVFGSKESHCITELLG